MSTKVQTDIGRVEDQANPEYQGVGMHTWSALTRAKQVEKSLRRNLCGEESCFRSSALTKV